MGRMEVCGVLRVQIKGRTNWMWSPSPQDHPVSLHPHSVGLLDAALHLILSLWQQANSQRRVC